MNPYMKDPQLWQMVHHRIISAIDSELNAVLPEEYVTRIEERVYVEGWRQNFPPDNVVVQTAPTRGDRNSGMGAAVLERPPATDALVDAPLTFEWFPHTVREPFVEIRTANSQEELIAVIEVLSPTNKAEGERRDEYRRKQNKIMHSWVHLLEIDLLRSGQYALAPDEDALRTPMPDFDYLISLHRGGRGAIVYGRFCFPSVCPG